MTVSASDAEEDRKFFGQPRPLANLFGVELWERFSFYGMQGILLIYLYYSVADGGLGIAQNTATSIVGAYGGAVYLSTILGAWTADRLLGPERVLFLSAVLVMTGHIALAVLPGLLGVTVGLILIAIGSGGVKANATSLVGSLYGEHDERRDAGFSLFYLGINLGALAGPLLTGLLQKNAGFHYGFGLAAIGMAVGLAQYARGRRRLPASAREIPNPLPSRNRPMVAAACGAALAVVILLAVTGVLSADRLATVVVIVSAAAAVCYFVVILTSRRITTVERRRVFSFIPMFLASAAFWSLYQQQFTVGDHLLRPAPRPHPVRLGNAGVLGAIHQPGLHHRAVRNLRRPLDPTRRPPAVDPDQVRRRNDHHGRGIPAVPTTGRRRPEQHPAARSSRNSPRLYNRRTAALTGRVVPVDQTRPASLPHPDGGTVLPVSSPWEPHCPAHWPATTALTVKRSTSAPSAP